MWLNYSVMSSKDADGMANSVDPGAVWYGSTLFAQAYLSENLRSFGTLLISSRNQLLKLANPTVKIFFVLNKSQNKGRRQKGLVSGNIFSEELLYIESTQKLWC